MTRSILILIGSVLCLRYALFNGLGKHTSKKPVQTAVIEEGVSLFSMPKYDRSSSKRSFHVKAKPVPPKKSTQIVASLDNPPVITPVAEPAKDDKKKDEAKEKDLRKKRKKKLEDLADGEVEKKTLVPAGSNLNNTIEAKYSQPAAPSSNDNGNNNNSGNSGGPMVVSLLPQASPSPTSSSSAPNSNRNVDLTGLTSNLVNHPTQTDVDTLTSEFRSQQITASQFYSVLNAMIASPVSDSHKYAIQAASLFPRAESFQILADETFKESNALIQNQASVDLEQYQDISKISILGQVLHQSDIYSKTRAADIISNIAVSIHSTPNLTVAQLHSLFDPMVALLAPLTADHSSPEASNLATLAQNAVSNIQNLFQGTAS